MQTAAIVIGRTPAFGLKGKTPYSMIFNQKADISWLQPFGSPAYALIPKDKQKGKFANKAQRGMLIGYTTGKKAYKLLDLETRKEFSSCHVCFDEELHSPQKAAIFGDQNLSTSTQKWEPNLLWPTLNVSHAKNINKDCNPYNSDNESAHDIDLTSVGAYTPESIEAKSEYYMPSSLLLPSQKEAPVSLPSTQTNYTHLSKTRAAK